MAQSIRFLRSCPSCHKSLQISIELLGKDVVCHFCGSHFRASAVDASVAKPVDEFDLRVAKLIQAADRQLAHYPGLAASRD